MNQSLYHCLLLHTYSTQVWIFYSKSISILARRRVITSTLFFLLSFTRRRGRRLRYFSFDLVHCSLKLRARETRCRVRETHKDDVAMRYYTCSRSVDKFALVRTLCFFFIYLFLSFIIQVRPCMCEFILRVSGLEKVSQVDGIYVNKQCEWEFSHKCNSKCLNHFFILPSP